MNPLYLYRVSRILTDPITALPDQKAKTTPNLYTTEFRTLLIQFLVFIKNYMMSQIRDLELTHQLFLSHEVIRLHFSKGAQS